MTDRSRPRRLAAALIAAGLMATGCASMQQRVTEEENRSNTLEAQVADLQATQQEIINRLKGQPLEVRKIAYELAKRQLDTELGEEGSHGTSRVSREPTRGGQRPMRRGWRLEPQ